LGSLVLEARNLEIRSSDLTRDKEIGNPPRRKQSDEALISGAKSQVLKPLSSAKQFQYCQNVLNKVGDVKHNERLGKRLGIRIINTN